MRDSLRTFCLRQLYQNPACSSKELVELAVQHSYLEASTNDHQTKLLSVLVGIPREERLNNDRFFPGGLAEFRAYDSLVAVLAQSRTLDTTLLRPLLGAVNLALHQDRRFYCLDDGSWYLQHQTIVNDELFTALQKQNADVSLKAWLESYIAEHAGTAPVFWSLDPRFVLEGEHVRLHAHCTLLGEEFENLWPAWEAQFVHGSRVSTESLLQTFQDDCRPSALALEQVLALKGVYSIGNDLWMHEAFIPKVPSVGGAVAFRVSDSLQEEPLAFPSLLVLDSLGMGEVVLTAAHRIYGVLPISGHESERLYQATGLGIGLGLKPEDHTFEVWQKDGFLFSEALAQRLALLGPGQRLRLYVTEEGLSFELRGFDTRIASTQNGLFSREELLLPSSALSASLLTQVQAEPEGINLSTLIANLGPDYSLSEITLALTSPLIERGSGGFCLYRALSFDPQAAVLALLGKSPESQPQDLSTSPTSPEEAGPIAEDEFLRAEAQEPSLADEDVTAFLEESPEPQSPEAWSKFQEDVEPYITLTEAELLELIHEQSSASKEADLVELQATDSLMDESLDDVLTAQAPALDTPPISAQTVVSGDEKKTFLPLSLEELFSLESEEETEATARISLEQAPVLEEESEEDIDELMHSLYEPEAQAVPVEEPEEHPPTVLPVEQVESIVEEQPVVLETQPADAPAVSAVEEADEIPQALAPEIIEPFVEPAAQEDAQPIISSALIAVTEVVVEAAEPTELVEAALEEVEEPSPPTPESTVNDVRLEDLAFVLTGEVAVPVEPVVEVNVERQAPITMEIHPVLTDIHADESASEAAQVDSEPIALLNLEDLVLDLAEEKPVASVESLAAVEVQAPILLEIHPLPIDIAADLEDETVFFASEPMEPSLNLEEIVQDLTETKELSLSDSAESVAGVITPLDAEPKEGLDINLGDLVLDLTGETVALETPFISVEDTFECFEEIQGELHEPIQAALEPMPVLWIDDLRMDLIKGEDPSQIPTEIPSVNTTSSPEAIAFLHTLFEEEREPVLEKELEETSKRPSASLQAKLDQLAAQREEILAQRQPAWTALMQSVMAQAALSPQQQEDFQGIWMGIQPVQSYALSPSVESSLCQLTVLNRLPAAGSLDLFVKTLKQHVTLGEVDPTDVLESLILPALQYQRTAEGWAQKLV
jgi:hypothetical protein